MASRTPKNYLAPLYNTTTLNNNNHNHFEFDEADIWTPSSSLASELKNPIPASRAPRKTRNRPSVASSLPVNIPDWSKIMGRRENGNDDEDNDVDDDDEEEFDDWMPPHEYVARKLARSRRIVPFSVHEGVGRTLKGRDLSRVRNAVWKQTGFED